jgi:hypothetical protein
MILMAKNYFSLKLFCVPKFEISTLLAKPRAHEVNGVLGLLEKNGRDHRCFEEKANLVKIEISKILI